MKDFITKTNSSGGNDSGTATRFGANESNSITEELVNAVEASSQTPTTYSGAADTDTEQLAKALTILGQSACDYTDSGSANAYVLTHSGSAVTPDAYFTGMRAEFETANSNTAASTINISSLGVKNIIKQDGSALVGGEIKTDTIVKVRYNGTAFELIEQNAGLLSQNNFLHIQDQKAQNTPGGTFTVGAWQTRDLTTEVTNSIVGASLATNQITLPKGTYYIEATAPALGCNTHQAKLYNITDTSDIAFGTSESTASGTAVVTKSTVTKEFTISAQKIIEVQHQCGTTSVTTGFGAQCNFATEVYTDVKIWKIK